MADTHKDVPCKVCEKQTPLRESRLCNMCLALMQSLVTYTPEARKRLDELVKREASWT